MKTKKSKKVKKEARITRFLDSVDWAFGLNNFDRILRLKEKDGGSVFAEIIYREDYQTVDINIYPSFFTQTLREQRKCLLHELCHAITIPSKSALHDTLNGKIITPERIKEINETETSKIENIVHRLTVGGLNYFKRGYKDYLKPIK